MQLLDHPARAIFRKRLIAAAMKKGATEKKATNAVDKVLGDLPTDKPFLDWLTNGGFEKLLAMILRILALA